VEGTLGVAVRVLKFKQATGLVLDGMFINAGHVPLR
jgi:hypothetical protein